MRLYEVKKILWKVGDFFEIVDEFGMLWEIRVLMSGCWFNKVRGF